MLFVLTAIGECSEDDWLELAKPNIVDRMAAYEEDQIEFSILGLVRDPLPDLIQRLAINVKSLEILHECFLPQEDVVAATSTSEMVLGPNESYGLTREQIDAVEVSEAIPAEVPPFKEWQRERWDELRNAQHELRARIREEQQSQRADEDYATGRRYDYGPAIRTWLRLLARKQQLAELLQ